MRQCHVRGMERSPLLTHILLCDRVCPAIVTKHLIGQINYPVTFDVTHLGKNWRKNSLLKFLTILICRSKYTSFIPYQVFGKTALKHSREILSELICKSPSWRSQLEGLDSRVKISTCLAVSKTQFPKEYISQVHIYHRWPKTYTKLKMRNK